MTLDDIAAHAATAWLLAAIVMGGLELIVPGVFFVFLAIAAAITGAAVFVLPELPAAAQLASFAVWSGVAVSVGRRWYRDYPVDSADPLLNDRAARLIGEIVTVAEAIEHGRGRVIVGDGVWTARGPDAPVGARVRIAGGTGGELIVEPLPAIDA